MKCSAIVRGIVSIASIFRGRRKEEDCSTAWRHPGLFLLVTVFFAAGAFAQPEYSFGRSFGTKSGHAEYRLTGELSGTKSLWWDDWGAKYREEIDTKEIFDTGKKRETIHSHSLALSDGEYFYVVNMRTMKGTKVRADVALAAERLYGAPPGRPLAGKSAKVLGRECDATERSGATVFSYKGVPLRVHERTKSGERSMEAVRFEENVAVASSRFAPPAKAKIEDATADIEAETRPEGNVGEGADEGDTPYPGVPFERFSSECKYVAGSTGYSMTSEEARYGVYSSFWEKEGAFLAFEMNPLATNLDWQVVYGEGAELLTHGGRRMGFRRESVLAGEKGVPTPGSVLAVEMKNEDALLLIIAAPGMTRGELVAVFDALRF